MKNNKAIQVWDKHYQAPMIEVIKIEIEQNILQSASGYTTPLNDIPDISGEYW